MTIDKLKHKALSCALPLVPAIMLNSCTTIESGSYQDQKTYGKTVYTEVMQKSFDYEGPGRNPVIVIHGLLGRPPRRNQYLGTVCTDRDADRQQISPSRPSDAGE